MSTFDIVLFGATGFTGRLVAEYLNAHGGDLRWALAGRNRAKLEAVQAQLGREDLPLFVGDSHEPETLRPIVRQAKVVISTVGPYSRHGTPLVEQCVEAGVGYCDLTGEIPWIGEMVDRFHERAEETGARIVHCCGFDSIPSDLGTLMLADHLEREHGRTLARVRFRVGKMKGGASGGTIASAFEVMEAARDRRIRAMLVDPYALVPARRGEGGRERMGFGKDDDRGRWTGPFVMAVVNAKIVRRSNALMKWRYGRDFEYEEAVDVGRGAGGFVRSVGLSAGLAAATGIASRPAGRKLLNRFVPQPGEGPSQEQRERGMFRIHLFGESDGDPPIPVRGLVAGVQDPGYGETAKMLSESGLCLARDDLPKRGGVLTPASAMGMTLVERLRRAGMTFEVD